MYQSRAKVVYGSVYEIPEGIGEFDICTFGSILLHLRDPFLALQRVTSHVRETAIVTDITPGLGGKILSILQLLTGIRLIRFLPDAKKGEPWETWWHLTPELVAEFLKILGFEDTEVFYHRQIYRNQELKLYTVVGRRTKSNKLSELK